jgi:hypothetical protein
MTATLRTDYDAFLFAPIGEDTSGMPLTLLSVLARLGIDPWEEAADLAQLPLEPALQRLCSRLEAMPAGRPASAADTVDIATRLMALLHRAPARKAPAPESFPQLKVSAQSRGVKLAIYCLIGMILMLVGQWAMSNPLASATGSNAVVPDLRPLRIP